MAGQPPQDELQVKDRSTHFREFLIACGSTLECPVCASNEIRRPEIKMMTSSCGHDMCDNCFRQKFEQSGETLCPHITNVVTQAKCNLKLKKKSFKPKEFSSGEVHRELLVRQEVTKFYTTCYSLETFGGDRAKYDEHLFQAEDMVFQLVNEPAHSTAWRIMREKLDRHKDQQKQVIAAAEQTAKRARREKHHELKREREAQNQKRDQNAIAKAGERRTIKLKKLQLKELVLNCPPEDVPIYMRQLEALSRPKKKQPTAAEAAAALVAKAEPMDENVMAIDEDGELGALEGMDYQWQPPWYMVKTGGPVCVATPLLPPRLVSMSTRYLEHVRPEFTMEAAGFVKAHVAKQAVQAAYSCLFD